MTCDLTEGLGLIADAIVTASNKGAISELAAAVNAIAQKNFCCDDQTSVVVNVNGGVNGTLTDGTVTYGTTPPITPPVTIPEGYESLEQYEAQKCAIAHAVVTGVVYALDALTAVASVNAIAATIGIILAAIPLVPVSPVLIPVLVPLVATAWLASGVLHAAALMVEENREELVCILISGNSIEIIFEQLSEALDIMIAAMAWSGPVALAVKSFIMVLINADTLNQLYGEFAGIMYPAADCEFCNEVPFFHVEDVAEAVSNGSAWINNVGYGGCANWSSTVGTQTADQTFQVSDVRASGCDYWQGKAWIVSEIFEALAAPKTLNFTVSGGTWNGTDPQWHLVYATAQGWQAGELWNNGNGVWAIQIPTGATRLFFFYNSPFVYFGSPIVEFGEFG